ncbi:hypothetical protein B566_EDAN011903 [Ephemera danica]|nr:hypothetical protein B566_EDAN011903 [Ephemera danica]
MKRLVLILCWSCVCLAQKPKIFRARAEANATISHNFKQRNELANRGVTCAMCQMGSNIVLGWIKAGHSRDEIVRKGVNLCVAFQIQQRHVCHGIIEANIDVLLYIHAERSGTDNPLTTDDFCYFALYPECPEPRGTFYNWTLDLDFLDEKQTLLESQPPVFL